MASELYNSLERFLLFRWLYPFGKEAPSFARVSETLKQDEILLSSDSFDADRLEPDALQSLYLQTLKDEAVFQRIDEQDDQTHQNLRKRKLPSPRLETLEEATQYAYLLPELVDRLYFRYQRDAVEAIRKEEHVYHSLQETEKEKGAEGTQNRQENSEPSSRSASHGVPSIQVLLRHEEEERVQDPTARRPSYLNGPPYQDSSQSLKIGAPPAAPSSAGREAHLPSNDPRYVQPSGYAPVPLENGLPHLPPPQYPAPPYPLPPPGPEVHRRRSSQPVPSPSPRMTQGSVQPPDRSSASPIILPPVSGMLRSQNTPTGSLEPVSEAGQPYRPNANMSPRPGQPAIARPHSQQMPAARNYSHQPYSYHDSRQYPAYHSYGQQGYYTQYSGPASNISQGGPYGTSPSYASPGPIHPPQHAGYYPQGYYNQSPISTPYSQQQPPRYAGLQTPLSDDSRRTFPLASVKTPTSSTKWKDVDLGKVAKPPGSPARPLSREVSPISDVDNSPEQDVTPAQRLLTRKQDKGENAANSVKPTSTTGRLSRGLGRAGRAGSASVSARGRTRSQSTTSHTDELSVDAKISATRRIKPEPSVTSVHEDEASTMDESSRKPGRRRRGTIREDDQPATPRSAVKRKRGNSSLPLPSPSADLTSGGPQLTPKAKVPNRPGYILATRNLQKTSSTLMQAITGHKDAYLFTKPLTERDAPGYGKLIFRPQDFKAIKTALIAGSKALAAIVDEAVEEINPGSKSIWIPETEDVVPPRGIVNSIQLEKEILRIFANAVMFNPELAENRGLGIAFQTRARTLDKYRSGNNEDDEGEAARSEIGVAKPVDGAVVKDTRKMCADVVQAFDEWRGIGRVDDAEAREAPIIGHPKDMVEVGEKEKDDQLKVGTEEATANAGEEGEQEVSEEPRAKRRRRQL